MLRRSPEEKAQKEAEKAEKRATDAAEYRAKWDQKQAEKAEKKAATRARGDEFRTRMYQAFRGEERKEKSSAKIEAEAEALLMEGETIEANFDGNPILTNKRIILKKARSIPYRSVVAVEEADVWLKGLRVSFGDGRERFTFKSKEDRDAAKQIILSHMLTPDTTKSA